ncbi:MAG: hypothetical protein WCA35_01470 [Kovacikia sp.]
MTIKVDMLSNAQDPAVRMSYAGVFANDPIFDDWMAKLAAICQQANTGDDAE